MTVTYENYLTPELQGICLWRLGDVDGQLHTLKEASELFGVPIHHIALAERAAKNRGINK